MAALKLHRNELELMERGAWERTRIESFYSALGTMKIRKPSDLFKFEWEKTKLNKEQIAEFNNQMNNDNRFPDKV